MKVLIVVLAVLATASAECPNGCSGHGTCGLYDMCTCYRNWQANDCSERVCPFGKAFVDSPAGDLNGDRTVNTAGSPVWTKVTAYGGAAAGSTAPGSSVGAPVFEYWPHTSTSDGTNLNADNDDEGHFYRECSNKGLCNRKSGECECFDGYTGSACQRTTCPSDCSGHGTCEYMRELADGPRISSLAASPAYHTRMMQCSGSHNSGECDWTASQLDDEHGTQYSLWDEESQMGCRCDAGWGGPDCSGRDCPLGDDPLTVGKSMSASIGIHGGVVPDVDNVMTDALAGTDGCGATGCDPEASAPADTGSFGGLHIKDGDFADLGRGVMAGDWVHISGTTNNNVPCRIKYIQDTDDPYSTCDSNSAQTISGSSAPVQFEGNHDGRLDQIVCYQGAEYDQLIDEAAASITVSAVHVDEVQNIKLDPNANADLFFRDMQGQEWTVGSLACAASGASQTNFGIIENWFTSIPNGAVEGIKVTSNSVSGKTTWEATARSVADVSNRCSWDVTFTHNPGAQNLLRCSPTLDNGHVSTQTTYDDVYFNAFHKTESGFGDSCDTTTEHYYTINSTPDDEDAGTDETDLSGLKPGERIRVEGSQWNDGWFTVGTIPSTASKVYVVEPVVDEGAGAKINIFKEDTKCSVYKKQVGTKESLPCSGRGLCDGGSGLCQCFRGSTGDDCSQQSALSM